MARMVVAQEGFYGQGDLTAVEKILGVVVDVSPAGLPTLPDVHPKLGLGDELTVDVEGETVTGINVSATAHQNAVAVAGLKRRNLDRGTHQQNFLFPKRFGRMATTAEGGRAGFTQRRELAVEPQAEDCEADGTQILLGWGWYWDDIGILLIIC